MLDLDYYNIEAAFAQIEEELISSMLRNMKRHTMQEVEEGKEWAQWQAVCLAELEEYKAANRTRFKREFSEINTLLEEAITQAREDGATDQEAEILEAIKNGYGYYRPGDAVNGRFFQVNDRKMEALIKATTHDMKRAEVAMLRRANDQYRKIIYATQVHMASGMTTYEKAVDMAARDFLMQGINCVKYKNGAVHNIKDYAGMVLRTTTKRAYLTGEGEMRQSWGMHLVIINKRGNACPLCAPFVGKVMIDDVWSGGKPDGKHLLMSNAVAAGLYHPNCRDSHTTYFGEEEDPYTKEEREELLEQTKQQSKQQYAKRQEKKYERLETYALDESNQKKYAARKKEWNAVARENVEERLKSLDRSKEDVVHTLDMRNVQEYRPISRDTKEYLDQRGNMEVHIRKIVNSTYEGGIYISNSVKMKRKEMHNMELSLNKAVESVGKGENLPKCIVISTEEMQTGAVCSYNAEKNVMYINSVAKNKKTLLALQAKMACPDNPLSTYVHEFIHWKDAQDYLKKNDHINNEEYLQVLRKKSKKRLDTLKKQGYDIYKISDYASKEIDVNKYDEAWTEYRTLKLLREGK